MGQGDYKSQASQAEKEAIRLRFSKRERLSRTRDFKNVYENARVFKGIPLTLYVAKNHLGYNRLGMSVSRNIAKKSTLRHRLKRLIREVYRKNKLFIKTGFDFVIKANKADRDLTYKIIESALMELLKRAGLIV